jgi:hypothetical protein
MRRLIIGLSAASLLVPCLARANNTCTPANVRVFGANPKGTTDSAPAFQSAFDQMADVCGVTTGSGTYTVGSRVNLPSGTNFTGTAGARINGTGTAGGIWSTVLAAFPIETDNTGTVLTSVVVGSATVTASMAQVPLVGDAILIGHGTAQAVYDVVAASGGPSQIAITVDRPIVWPWVPGDLVTEVYSYPQNIQVSGNGLQLSGVGVQLIEAAQARNLFISGLTCGDVGQVTGSPFGLDCACRDSVIEDISCAHTNSSAAIYLQSNEASVVRRLQASGGGGAVNLLDCYNSVIQDSWSNNSTIGNDFQVTAINPGYTFGSINSWVTGGGVVDSAGSAYAVSYSTGTLVDNVTVMGGINGADVVASTNTTIRDMTVRGVENDAVSIDSLSSGTTIEGADIRGAKNGIEVGAGAVGTRVSGSSIAGATESAITSSSDLTLQDIEAECSAGGGSDCVRSTAGSLLFERGRLTSKSGGSTLVQISGGTAELRDLNANLTTGINQTAFYLTGGATYLENVTVTGPAQSYGLYATGSTTTVVIGPGCNFSGTAFPVTAANGASIRLLQTGGVVNVAVSGGNSVLPFPDNYKTTLTVTGKLSSDATITPAAIAGLEFTVSNQTSGPYNLGLRLQSTVNVARGKRARVGVSAGGDVVRLSPDI